MNPLLKRSDMARDSKGITQFHLPPTHEPYLPLLPSRRASPPFGWYSLRLPTEAWPGWVDLGDWLYTEIDFPAPGIEPRTRSPIVSGVLLFFSVVLKYEWQVPYYMHQVNPEMENDYCVFIVNYVYGLCTGTANFYENYNWIYKLWM